MLSLLKRESVEESSVQSDLADVFRRLDIRPFTPESVTAYQAEMIRQDTPFLRRHLPLGTIYAAEDAVDWVNDAGGYFLCCMVLLIGLGVFRCFHNGWLNLALCLAGLGLGIVWLSLILVEHFLSHAAMWCLATWPRVRRSEYDKQVPEFAIQTADDVGQSFPEAEIYVEAFSPGWDPFLVVRYGDRDYYVEVWNEPDFNQKRQA